MCTEIPVFCHLRLLKYMQARQTDFFTNLMCTNAPTRNEVQRTHPQEIRFKGHIHKK